MMSKNHCILLMIFSGLSCLCSSIPILDNTKGSKPISRVPRHAGLCPKGMSRETCFYSQLNMFMKIHDSMMDPVSLRNIGKRNEDSNFATSGKDFVSSADDLLDFYDNDLDGDILQLQPIDDDVIYNLEESSTDKKRKHKITLSQFLEEFNRRLNEIKQIDEGGLAAKAEVKRDQAATYLPPQSKRHIICPASMTRVECYDQALAFYMRLIRSVGKQ